MANVGFAVVFGLGGLAYGLIEASGGFSEKLSPGGLMIFTAWAAWGVRLFLEKR